MRWSLVAGLCGTTALAGLAVGSAVFPGLRSIPNLDNVPSPSATTCQVCHVSSQGGSLNVFGETVKAHLNSNHQPDWSAIWNLDSDGDTYTNGQELGDPTGQWTPGMPNPGSPATITHPGDRASKPGSPSSVRSVRTPAAWAVIKALFR